MITETERNKYLQFAENSADIEDYILTLVEEKARDEILGWQDIANLVEEAYGFTKSRHWYYRNYGDTKDILRDDIAHGEPSSKDIDVDSFQAKMLELQKEKVKVSDERNQTRAYIRRLAREETLKEIALQAVENMSAKKLLPLYPKTRNVIEKVVGENKEAIVLLGDWHYGFDFELPWNKFNTEICRERVAKLLNETIEYCGRNNVKRITYLIYQIYPQE